MNCCVLCCVFSQRLAGASLLVFANKQDLPGALTAEEIRTVSYNIGGSVANTLGGLEP